MITNWYHKGFRITLSTDDRKKYMAKISTESDMTTMELVYHEETGNPKQFLEWLCETVIAEEGNLLNK